MTHEEEIEEIREILNKFKWQDDDSDPRSVNKRCRERYGNDNRKLFFKHPEKEIYKIFIFSFKNPLTLHFDDEDDDILNEAIQITYPIDTVKRWLNEIYVQDKLVAFESKEKNGVLICGLIIPDITDVPNRNIEEIKENEHFKKLVKNLKLCGYFLAACSLPKGENYITAQFEPLHAVGDSKNSMLERGIRYLWHLSPNFYKEKILKNGLCPYSRNEYLDYPPRVYFLLPILKKDELQDSIKELEHVRRRGKINKSIDYKKTQVYTKYAIDLTKVNNDTVFYCDRNAYNAYYTKENIPPSAIVKTEDVKFKY